MNNVEEIAVLRTLIDILDRLNIAYAIGGSMASSVYGAVRFTQDADITVEPSSMAADKLCQLLQKDFYISKDAINQAVKNNTSFNVIHLTTAFKIDIFVMANKEFRKQIFSRSKKLPLGESIEKLIASLVILSPKGLFCKNNSASSNPASSNFSSSTILEISPYRRAFSASKGFPLYNNAVALDIPINLGRK